MARRRLRIPRTLKVIFVAGTVSCTSSGGPDGRPDATPVPRDAAAADARVTDGQVVDSGGTSDSGAEPDSGGAADTGLVADSGRASDGSTAADGEPLPERFCVADQAFDAGAGVMLDACTGPTTTDACPAGCRPEPVV